MLIAAQIVLGIVLVYLVGHAIAEAALVIGRFLLEVFFDIAEEFV